MILDKISNSHLYEGMGELYKKAFDYLKNTDFLNMELGRYELEGENLYVMVQEYIGKPIEDYKVEAHQHHTDIQFIVKGCEKMGYVPIDNAIAKTAYNSERDCTFYTADVEWFTVSERMFGLFLPDDTHAPGIEVNSGETIRKVVAKIKIK